MYALVFRREMAVVAFMLVLASFVRCSKDCVEPTGEPSLSNDVQPLFTAQCALSGCHDVMAGSGELVLLEGQAYSQLVNVSSILEPGRKRVLPGDPENSYLIMKLENRQSEGEAMPLGGSLGAGEIQLIRDWIEKGAKDN
jgi:hypothetical protein